MSRKALRAQTESERFMHVTDAVIFTGACIISILSGFAVIAFLPQSVWIAAPVVILFGCATATGAKAGRAMDRARIAARDLKAMEDSKL